jgi:4-amino-4-deoxy-L-arabinose transferase-like glycosyltransferase
LTIAEKGNVNSATTRHKWQDLIVFAAILLLAAFLRVYRLDELPPGLHYDEAFNATMAQRVLAGVERPIFFREDLTEEPMAIYVTSLFFALFGASPWSLRLVSAFAGIANVAALYLLARALFRSRWLAALAAFVLAILYWHVNFSRLGMEPIFTPLMLTLSFAFLWRASSDAGRVTSDEANSATSPATRHASRIALAGLFLGATLYTYKAALFAPILAAIFIVVEIIAAKKPLAPFALFALCAILAFAPLGLYFVAHPNEFLERPSSVTIASSGIAPIADNAIKVAGMFFVRGDDNPRSNLPERPALDPVLAIGFIAGLIAAGAQIRKSESRLLLLWLVVMSLPSVLTDFAPHFGRNIGATPAIALIVALGFGTLFDAFARRAQWTNALVVGILVSSLALGAYSTARDYFAVWGARTGAFDSFDVGILSLAQKLGARPAREWVYLSPIDQYHYTAQFGLAGRAARSFDGRRVLVLPPPGVVATYGIVTREDTQTLARLGKFLPNGRALETLYDFLGKPYATIWRAESAPRLAPQRIVQARWGETIELIGYDIARAGNALALTLYWSGIAETREDYTVFAHLVGARNPATQSPLWAQDDARPGRGSYPTPRWQAGEIVIDEYRLALPENLPRGEYRIEIGMYLLESGARVRVTDADGAPMENNRVDLETRSLP